MRPQLKEFAWDRDGDQLRLVYDVRDRFVLNDSDGSVERLLDLLREGGRTTTSTAHPTRADEHHQSHPLHRESSAA